MPDTDANSVTDNPDASRFELTVDGQLAELRYRLDGQRLVLIHTDVPDALEGQGLGGTLVKAALDRASRDGLRIVPEWLRSRLARASSRRSGCRDHRLVRD